MQLQTTYLSAFWGKPPGDDCPDWPHLGPFVHWSRSPTYAQVWVSLLSCYAGGNSAPCLSSSVSCCPYWTSSTDLGWCCSRVSWLEFLGGSWTLLCLRMAGCQQSLSLSPALTCSDTVACVLVAEGTACGFITPGSQFVLLPGVATLLLLPDRFLVDCKRSIDLYSLSPNPSRSPAHRASCKTLDSSRAHIPTKFVFFYSKVFKYI